MNLRLLRIFSVPFALTVCTSFLHALPANITASTQTINLLCTVGQPCATTSSPSVAFYTQTVTLTEGATSDAYTIAAPTVPWLTVSPLSATVSTTQALAFTVTPVGWTTLPQGLNTTTITLNSTTTASIAFTVNLQIQAAASTLIVKGGLNVLNPVNYVAASPITALAMSFTVVSTSGLPVPFTVALTSVATPTGGTTTWLATNSGDSTFSASGIAYSWGTNITVYASQAVIAAANPGDNLTGQITITPNGLTANNVVMPVNIVIAAGAPTVSAIAPTLVPQMVSGVAPGFVTFVIHGSNFISAPPAQKTKVFWGATAPLSACTNAILADYVSVINSNYLQVTVPYSSAGVPFATNGATAVYIGVANGAAPTQATASTSVGVTSAPIISGVTSASSFVELASPKIAPYDIISIFGSNLCPLCTGSNSVLVGVPDAWGRFPLYLSPDGGTHKISVPFTKTALGTPLPGYLLFATNNQINVAVPGGITSSYINLQVAYDNLIVPPLPPTVANTSAVFGFTYAAADPGLFTIESSGQGQGAITDGTGALNSVTNFATNGTSVVSIYLTGLGIPTAVGTNTANGSAPTTWYLGTSGTSTYNCISPLGTAATPGNPSTAPTGYMDTVNTPYSATAITNGAFQQASSYVVPAPLWTSIDGAVLLQSELNTNVTVPCFYGTDTGANLITVTIGGTAVLVGATGITYAGFVNGSIEGLYQINVQVPVPVTAGWESGTSSAVPVTVSMGSAVSQSGVTMFVK
jgi:uncharacterized protein (TIGR03437 family)